MLSSEPIEELVNIGPTVGKRLRQIGIKTRRDLEMATPVATYLHLSASFQNKHLPVCYYLYSLEGALRGVHWNALPESVKKTMTNEVSQRRSQIGRK